MRQNLSIIFLVSDLLEYLERADLDGKFALNILQSAPSMEYSSDAHFSSS